MTKGKLDNIWIGMAAGAVGAVLGFVLFGLGFAQINNCTFSYFYNDVFMGVSDFQSRIVTFSMLIDVVLFFIFLRINMLEFAKGLMAVLVLSVLVVAWLY